MTILFNGGKPESEAVELTNIIGSKETFLEADHEAAMEFLETVSDITAVPAYQMLKKFVHHNSTTRYQHCLNVAWYTFIICRQAGLDYKSAARGAMLHDFYLYDTNEFRKTGMNHNAVHPRCAFKNACKYFDVNDVMKDCILNHMWPATTAKPATKEGLILTFVDKYCASLEWGTSRARRIRPIVQDMIDRIQV